MAEESKVRSETAKDPKAVTEAETVAKAKAVADAKKAVEKSGTKHKVINHLSHDGQDYLPGDEVALDEDTASRLIDLGVVEEA